MSDVRDAKRRGRAAGLLVSLALLISSGSLIVADNPQNEIAKVAVYDPNPDHLWNRLHASLYVRVDANGTSTGHDELDAPLWRHGSYLMTEPSYSCALNVLDEFIRTKGELLIRNPLKRAMMQRDLWAVFDYLADSDQWKRQWRREQGLTERQDQLLLRLGTTIRRLALTREEIANLPDNYSLAARSKLFPTQYDPTHDESAFFPPDLLLSDGPWRSYGTNSEVTAPQHNRAYSGRAIFMVLLRLPEGREATAKYLHEHPSRIPSPSEIPKGTQVALVKQAMLIDDQGEIRPTQITEQVQLRAYDEMDRPDAYEFNLSRKGLFEGNGGGLHPLRGGEIHFNAFMESRTQRPLDPFEYPFPTRASMPIPVPRQASNNHNLMKSCRECHQAERRPGIGSFLSDGPLSDRDSLVSATIRWKQQQETWHLWRQLSERDK